MSIAVIAGLGNPGPEYRLTRHNIGWFLVDRLAESCGAAWKQDRGFLAETARVKTQGRDVLLVKPLTYMNESGRSLGAVARFYKFEPSQFAVVHDDINLELGRVKVSERGSDGGHNGLTSVIAELGESFVRYRVGIGHKPHPAMDLKDFVLGKWSPAETAALQTRLSALDDGLKYLLVEGPQKAMNLLNHTADKTDI